MAVKVGMVCLGCAKNRVDAEMMLFTLREAGFEIVRDAKMSDVAIVNTCGFIEDAKQESIDEIFELVRLKKRGRIKAIVATGCLAQRYGSEVMKELYELDAVVGIGGNEHIAEVINEVISGKKTELLPDKEELPLCGGRVYTTPFYYSYLKIAEGCDNMCTYCAIPMIRGHFRSRDADDIVAEAKRLAESGVRELILIAQDTSRYGEDLCGHSMLPELLRRLCRIEGDVRFRVLYCYPERITDELIDVIATEDKILKYIDIPLQHCSAPVLKRMNRHGDNQSLRALVARLREKVKGITIRTTLMVGFPGETEEQFEELSQFVEDMRFERMGCFAYSPEEDTPAARLPDQIDEETKQRRRDILMEQQGRIMAEDTSKFIGRRLPVLCEGFDRNTECWFGRGPQDAPEVDCRVYFVSTGTKPRIGQVVMVDIIDNLDCDLMGNMVN